MVVAGAAIFQSDISGFSVTYMVSVRKNEVTLSFPVKFFQKMTSEEKWNARLDL